MTRQMPLCVTPQSLNVPNGATLVKKPIYSVPIRTRCMSHSQTQSAMVPDADEPKANLTCHVVDIFKDFSIAKSSWVTS
jgi:hypothetical protein